MKRQNHFQNSVEKKPRVDENFEDLWGPDPDMDDIDDCILQASQMCEKEDKLTCTQSNNISIMPSYNAFAHKVEAGTGINTSILSSTKLLDDTITASTSNFYRKQANPTDILLKTLQDKYEAKEGEVTILRNKIKQNTYTLNTTHARKEQELMDKLNSSKVELKRVTEELEFKALEIFNLKSKILNMSKISGLDPCAREKLLTTSINDLKLETFCITSYPLKNVISSNIFHQSTESGLDFRCIMKDTNITDEALFTCRMNNYIRFEDILPNISEILNSSLDELNSKRVSLHIRKIVQYTLQLLNNFQEHLKQFEKCIQSETIRKLDLEYLMGKKQISHETSAITNSHEWFREECGIRCRQMLALLSEILIYSDDLTNFITMNQSLLFKEGMPTLSSERNSEECIILKIILETLQIIGKIRKTYIHSGFLAGVCCFLEKLCQKLEGIELPALIIDLLINIATELIFARPNSVILYYLAKFLKNASLHAEFVQALCHKPTTNSIITKKNKGIVLFQKNSCILEVFSLIYKDNLMHCDALNDDVDIQRHLNILKFISNILSSNVTWLYYQENTHYNCLFELNKLTIMIIHYAFNKYLKKDLKRIEELLRISVKILHELNFKSYEFIERDVKICAQYTLIKEKLIVLQENINFREFDVECLETLNSLSVEEPTQVETSILNKIDLWTK